MSARTVAVPCRNGVLQLMPFSETWTVRGGIDTRSRAHAHPVSADETLFMEKGDGDDGEATQLILKRQHAPDQVILTLPGLVDFCIKDAVSAYVVTAQGAHEATLSPPTDGDAPPAPGPVVVSCEVFGPASGSPCCCAWDATRQVLYIASSLGDVAAWSPTGAGGTGPPLAPRLIKRLSGTRPVHMAVDEHTGWLVLLLCDGTLCVVNAAGAVAVLPPPLPAQAGAAATAAAAVHWFCIMPDEEPGCGRDEGDDGTRSKGSSGSGDGIAGRSGGRGAAFGAVNGRGYRGLGGADYAPQGGWRRRPTYLGLADKEFVLLCVGSSHHEFLGYSRSSVVFVKPLETPAAQRLAADLGAALTGGVNSDVSLLCCDGRRVPAHRMILAARFPYFASLFSGRWPARAGVGAAAAAAAAAPAAPEDDCRTQPSAVGASRPQPPHDAAASSSGGGGAGASDSSSTVVLDAPSDVVSCLLHWGYTGALGGGVSADTVAGVVALADQWCVDDAKALCEECLLRRLDGPNLADSLRVADGCGMAALRAAALARIAADWGGLSRQLQTGLMAALPSGLAVDVVDAVSRKRQRGDE